MIAYIISCIKYLLFLGIPIFCFFKRMGLDYFDSISWTVSALTLIFIPYAGYFWRLNPCCKIPRIYGMYDIKIFHQYNGGGEKTAQAEISQSLFDLRIKLKTDEITSYSTTAKIVMEDNCYILYYTYIKRPKSKYEEKNPIMYGTCRLVLDNSAPIFTNTKNSRSIRSRIKRWIFKPGPQKIEGVYWTSGCTKGDITFIRRDG